jgi:hypothetical protein
VILESSDAQATARVLEALTRVTVLYARDSHNLRTRTLGNDHIDRLDRELAGIRAQLIHSLRELVAAIIAAVPDDWTRLPFAYRIIRPDGLPPYLTTGVYAFPADDSWRTYNPEGLYEATPDSWFGFVVELPRMIDFGNPDDEL